MLGVGEEGGGGGGEIGAIVRRRAEHEAPRHCSGSFWKLREGRTGEGTAEAPRRGVGGSRVEWGEGKGEGLWIVGSGLEIRWPIRGDRSGAVDLGPQIGRAHV